MLTFKFGGTAITPQNVRFVKQATQNQDCIVVVSAPGKTYSSDVKVTDLLARYHADPSDENWQPIAAKFVELARATDYNSDLDKLLFVARRSASSGSLAHCMSLGEELSAKIMASYLGFAHLEAANAFWFDSSGKLDVKKTVANLKSATSGVRQAVIGGFYGSSDLGRAVFSRGGSDVSGTYCAVATNSNLYLNCTDVCGVFVADPSKVVDSRRLTELSYEQMRRLSLAGATVLHSQAVMPLAKYGIPLEIKSFYTPHKVGTLVTERAAQNAVLSVTEKKQCGSYCCQVLHCLPLFRVGELLTKFLGGLARSISLPKGGVIVHSSVAVRRVSINSDVVKIYADSPVLNAVYDAFAR